MGERSNIALDLTASELLELEQLSPARDYYSGDMASSIFNTVPHDTRSRYLWRNPGAGIIIVCETEDGADIIRAKRFDNTWKTTFGGAVEPGESFLQTAFREAEEEWFHIQLGKLQLQNYIHLNRARRIQHDRLRGFDYVTGVAVIQCSSRALNVHLNRLKIHATHALAALDAMIKTDDFLKNKQQTRVKSAQFALKDKHLIECISAHPGSDDVMATLQQIASGEIEFQPVDKMQDKRAQVIMNFTEYSDFQRVPADKVLQSIQDAESGICLTEVFKLDPFSVTGLVCKYINGKFAV